MRTSILSLSAAILALPLLVPAQSVVFDFDNTPAHTPLPIDVTVDGITAHLSYQFYGYSVQAANTFGFTPLLFGGNCIWPNTVFRDDLYVNFSTSLSEFSMLYSPQELACSSSARMRVTAYQNGVYVGTSTTTAPGPGTWPTGRLTFNSAVPFNQVTIHYDAPPPTGGDFGVIFMADYMAVSPFGGPTTETLPPISQTINLGKLDGGNVGDLATQDARFETICKFLVPNSSSPIVRLTLDYKTTKPAPSRLEFFTSSRMGQPGLFMMRLLLANQYTGLFDELMPPTRVSDEFQYGLASWNNPPDYVGADGSIRGRIEVLQTGPSTTLRPCTEIDLAVMNVSG